MATSDSQPAHSMSRKEVTSVILGLMTAMFPGALDSTIMATALPTVGQELGDIEHLPWLITAYLLMSTASAPLFGKLSDIQGRRVMLLAALATFAFGSLLCALAPNMVMLALARGVQGVGGGGLVSLSITIIGDIVPVRQRPKYQVYTSIMWTTSSLAGPVLGGYFAEKWHWSMIFWLNMPMCLLAYLMVNTKLKRLPRHERPHKLDFAGAVLLVTASVLLQLALLSGGVRYPWLSVEVLGLLACGLVAAGLFVWRLLTAAEPLVPLALFANKVFRTAATATAVAMGVSVALTIYVPMHFQHVLGLSASESGVALMPLMVGTMIGAITAGRLMIRVVHYRRVPIVGMVIAVLCIVPIALAPAGLSMLQLEILFATASIGIGTITPVSMISVQNSVATHQLGTATAAVAFMRNFGAATGVAIFGAIVIGGRASAVGVHGANAMPTGENLVGVFQWIFTAAILGLLLSTLLISRMPERPLGREPTPERLGGERQE